MKVWVSGLVYIYLSLVVLVLVDGEELTSGLVVVEEATGFSTVLLVGVLFSTILFSTTLFSATLLFAGLFSVTLFSTALSWVSLFSVRKLGRGLDKSIELASITWVFPLSVNTNTFPFGVSIT